MKHLKPVEAHQLLQDNPQAVMVDCRSEMEYLFVGHPVGAHHVAWNDGPDWEINPHFVGQVKKVASANRPVVLICRSGHRSVDAGLALEEAGFSEVYNVLEGFEGALDEEHHRGTLGGWRKEGLPWEQV
jgi:rhodanese-related sulfurtransferase